MHKILVSITLLILWQVLVKVSSIPVYMLPAPLAIFNNLIANASLITTHALITVGETLLGLIIAVFLGVSSALILDHFERLQHFLKPILLTLQATPPFVLMPILLLWFGFGLLPKLIVICLSCYFPITVCLLDGLKRSPLPWMDMATIMQANSKTRLWFVRFPAALPALISGIRLAAIHAPLTVLAADWIGASSGLGYLIMLSHGRLQVDLMFACIFCIILMVFALNKAVYRLEKKLIFWPSVS
jgi:putative hydroxymethylpyrimidine transport system permease protein